MARRATTGGGRGGEKRTFTDDLERRRRHGRGRGRCLRRCLRYYIGPVDRNITTGISVRDRSFVKGGCKQAELISFSLWARKRTLSPKPGNLVDKP